MRIVWKEENARAVSKSLEEIRQEMELGMRAAGQVREALKEADPDGTNKRLKVLSARFEAAMERLSRTAEDAEALRGATDQMIQTFESRESEVIRLLNSLDPGRGTAEDGIRRGGVEGAGAREHAQAIPPIALPKPRIAPVMRFSAMGPVMGWVSKLMDRV